METPFCVTGTKSDASPLFRVFLARALLQLSFTRVATIIIPSERVIISKRKPPEKAVIKLAGSNYKQFIACLQTFPHSPELETVPRQGSHRSPHHIPKTPSSVNQLTDDYFLFLT